MHALGLHIKSKPKSSAKRQGTKGSTLDVWSLEKDMMLSGSESLLSHMKETYGVSSHMNWPSTPSGLGMGSEKSDCGILVTVKIEI